MNLTKTLLFLLIASVMLTGEYTSRSVAESWIENSTTGALKKFTTADLAKLKWIEGTWRGTGDVEKPFYERYRFENETTLLVDSPPEVNEGTADEPTRFVLKEGEFGNGGDGSRWAATVIDDRGITFEPISKAKNSFRWERVSQDSWIATLKWPAADGKPARERVYKMERWPAKP